MVKFHLNLRAKKSCGLRKSEHMTFVHFNIGLRGNVILSVAKNLSERPFVALRVTTLVCQSFVVRFRSKLPNRSEEQHGSSRDFTGLLAYKMQEKDIAASALFVLAQLSQQHLGLLQVLGVKAFSKPIVDI